MSLLVEYSVAEGKAEEQIDALKEFISGLRDIGDEGYSYTAFETDDPTKFIAVLEFQDEGGKQRFLDSVTFANYREGAVDRFQKPPSTTSIRLIASTKD